jgi:hypothetical protein
MRKTPELVSRARQVLAGDIRRLKAEMATAREDPEKLAFARAELSQCLGRLEELRYKGKRTFWR